MKASEVSVRMMADEASSKNIPRLLRLMREIPAEALREALVNCLCHRQLERYNLTPGIAIYDDLISKFSLEVYSDPVDAAFKALGIK